MDVCTGGIWENLTGNFTGLLVDRAYFLDVLPFSFLMSTLIYIFGGCALRNVTYDCFFL